MRLLSLTCSRLPREVLGSRGVVLLRSVVLHPLTTNTADLPNRSTLRWLRASAVTLETLQDIGDEGARQVAREAFEGGLVFLKEPGRGWVHLILLAEDVFVVGIQDLVRVQILQPHVGRNLNLQGGGGAGVEVKGDDPGTDILDRTLQYGVGIIGIGRDLEMRALQELPGDGGSKLLLDVESGGLVLEGRHCDRLDVGRDEVAAARDVITTPPREEKKAEGRKQ